MHLQPLQGPTSEALQGPGTKPHERPTLQQLQALALKSCDGTGQATSPVTTLTDSASSSGDVLRHVATTS